MGAFLRRPSLLSKLCLIGLFFASSFHPRSAPCNEGAFFTQPITAEPKSLWIDTDPAIGLIGRDVDDAFALLHLLSKKPHLISGISVVYGNTSNREHQIKVLQKIFEKLSYNDSITYYLGAKSPKDLSKENQAVKALGESLEEAKRHGSKKTILALGPLTNIATVLKKRPDLADWVRELILIGGQHEDNAVEYGKLGLQLPDLNIDLDPKAFEWIFQQPIPLTLVPQELTYQLAFTETDLKRINGEHPLHPWLIQHSQRWLWVWQLGLWRKSFTPFDLSASALFVYPDSFQCHDPLPAVFKTLPDNSITRKGPWSKKKQLRVGNQLNSSRMVRYCYKMDKHLKNQLIEDLHRLEK